MRIVAVAREAAISRQRCPHKIGKFTERETTPGATYFDRALELREKTMRLAKLPTPVTTRGNVAGWDGRPALTSITRLSTSAKGKGPPPWGSSPTPRDLRYQGVRSGDQSEGRG